MENHATNEPRSGGLSQFFVEHREVAWLFLVTALVWGALAYQHLAQQEDPTIPHREAMLVTNFPGATASKVEELISKPLERKISELESIEEMKTESRYGVSTIRIKQSPGSQMFIEQQWEKLRAKLHEVQLPQGAEQPFLNTDFGNTITLLLALTSPPITDAECVARTELIRTQLAELRGNAPLENHAAIVVFFPPQVAQSYRQFVRRSFETEIRKAHFAEQIQTRQGASFILADLTTTADRDRIEKFVAEFTRQIVGSDLEMKDPDFTRPIVLIGAEDPLPAVRAAAPFRYSYRTLELLARDFEDSLKQLPPVGKVTKIGIVSETVYLLYSKFVVAGYGLSPEKVGDSIAARNAVIPGGTIRTEAHNFPVQLSGEFRDEKEMLGTVVGLSHSGAPIYLRDIFEVRRMYESPIPYKVDVFKRDAANGEMKQLRAVMVAVEMKEGQIIAQFDAAVRALVANRAPRLPEGIEVQTLSNQPVAVAHRIHHFARCFIEAVVIVVIVSLFLMDWRSAVVVATAIPLTVAITLAAMQLLNIALHQVSIAALIIALGMLVDVPVVASDGINRELHKGEPRLRAAWLGPHGLRRPMIFGTIINIVAFLPLLLLPGDTGAFIGALPMVVSISLVGAFLVATIFTPLVGFYVLKGQAGFEEGGQVRSFFLFRPVDLFLSAVLPRYRALLQWGLRRPWIVLGAAYSLLAASFLILPLLGTQFFPPAERNQMLVDIELPTTSSLASLQERVDRVAAVIKRHEEVASMAVFSGGTAPRFYYNIAPKVPANYLAQIIVNTRAEDDVPPLLVKLRQELDREIPGARCMVKQLEQGPPIDEPIQIRISGENLDVLTGLAAQAASVVRDAGGYQVHDDLGVRMPNLQINIDQDRANSLGVDNQQIGQVSQAAFAGLKVTELREGDRLIPVVIRLQVGERNEVEKMRALYVLGKNGSEVPLESFASLKLQPEFVTIPHYNQLRTVTVKAYAPAGELASRILDRARTGLAAISLPPGYSLQFAGEHKELAKNRAEMAVVLQVSLALITLAMVLQFNSVIKSIVVMLTVPLGVIGAFIGLGLSHSPFGFMALLAIISLAGVMVSHIIVLSDFIEEARAKGMPLEQALVQAGLARLRPVLVTVLATVGGLVPLFLTGGALWHPLTAVHICGLLLATVLTLVVLPVLYYVFCAKLHWIK